MILHIIVEQEIGFWIYVNLYRHIRNPNLGPFYCKVFDYLSTIKNIPPKNIPLYSNGKVFDYLSIIKNIPPKNYTLFPLRTFSHLVSKSSVKGICGSFT